MKNLWVLVVAIGLSGCAIGWVKPDGTDSELDRDQFACQQQATQMFPQVMMQQQVGGGYFTPSRTQCYGYAPNISCITYPGEFVPPQFAIVDVNEQSRNSTINACLRSRGYSFHIGFK